MTKNEDLLYTVAEVARMLKVNRNFVYHLIDQGDLNAVKIGCLKIRKSTLEKYLEQKENA